MPDGLWEIAKPLIPPSRVQPQGGGTQGTPDETLFAAIVYVLVSGCRAGVWGRLHEAVPHRLDDAGLIDVTRVVLDTAHVRAKKSGGGHTGPSPVDRGKPGSKMHILSDANGLPLLVGVSAGNVQAAAASCGQGVRRHGRNMRTRWTPAWPSWRPVKRSNRNAS